MEFVAVTGKVPPACSLLCKAPSLPVDTARGAMSASRCVVSAMEGDTTATGGSVGEGGERGTVGAAAATGRGRGRGVGRGRGAGRGVAVLLFISMAKSSIRSDIC